MSDDKTTIYSMQNMNLHEKLKIDEETECMRVNGGWLYITTKLVTGTGYRVSVAQTFVKE